MFGGGWQGRLEGPARGCRQHTWVAAESVILHLAPHAVGALSTNPRNTVSQLKRLLGKKFSDPTVQADLAAMPFCVVEGPAGECLYEVQAREGGLG